MGIWEFLKKFFTPKVKSTLDSTRKGFQNALLKIESGADNFSDENIIKKEVNELLEMFPGSPKFLGKNTKYPKPKRRLFIFQKHLPNLIDLRDAVSQLPEKLELDSPRKKILRLVESHKYFPDVHALHAIQIFNDTIQSSNDIKKTNILKGSLIEMTKAIINGGTTIFNITWFIKIYLKYLELLNINYINQHKAMVNHFSQTIRIQSNDIHKNHVCISALMTIADKLGGLTILNQRLRGTPFFKTSISNSEIRGACSAIIAGEDNKEVSSGKDAKNIMWVLLTFLLLFAKIPILRGHVNKTLSIIPDLNRDLILQKFMVISMQTLTDFRLTFAVGDREKAKTQASRLFNRSSELIKQYLEYSILTKPYEVEPFLKAAWITKESVGLFSDSEYQKMINQSLAYLKTILSKSKKLKTMNDQALVLQNYLINIKIEYGWAI
ncbi:MAG: hypothetical protein HOD92_24360 [Deltaproteobacteria bacterium]|jgi:hypothetical protein|nr:hypothetical protein [Deltaproteobacteria bacterium]